MLSRKVIFYAILHFLTDFCCAFFMFHLADNVADIYGYFLLYNFCAFAYRLCPRFSCGAPQNEEKKAQAEIV